MTPDEKIEMILKYNDVVPWGSNDGVTIRLGSDRLRSINGNSDYVLDNLKRMVLHTVNDIEAKR